MAGLNIIQFIKDKFNPTRPMGRKNFIWSYVACIIAIIPILFLTPSTEISPVPARTALLIELINTPLILLQLRRSKAANIPTFLVFIGWILDFSIRISYESPLENVALAYGIGLIAALLFVKNKIEPDTP